MAHLLIADDDSDIREFLSELVEILGHRVSVTHTLNGIQKKADMNNFDLILLDLEFSEGNGLQVLPDLLDAPSKPEVIIITGTGGIDAAELAFKYGAWDYIQKPFVFHEVSLPITRALQYRQEKQVANNPPTLKHHGIIGSSAVIGRCLGMAAKASVTEASVLILGETGTGKELFARAIHENSKRSEKNFVVVDCGALPETLVEGILFGHEKGAFTGADKQREGLFLRADGGTLFLDEIGELPYNTQKSLLRCLQERRILPLGGKREIPVDFRLVAATNRNLDQMVEKNLFRSDLLYRIRSIEIKLPPLRDRTRDIQEIAMKKILQLARQYGVATKGLSPEFLDILNVQAWSGNVRELINVLEYALTLSGGDPVLFPKHLPPEYRIVKLHRDFCKDSPKKAFPVESHETDSEFPTLHKYREKAERTYLEILIEKVNGDRENACVLSGMSQSRLYALLKKHRLSRFGS